ncbi:MAG: S8 family serine peptidase, partial [Oceanisphaera sp.]|nr:S8 family serine peptidase [Oceanisphaera sp.]
MSEINFKTLVTGTALLLAGLPVINAQAGTLDPKLEAAVADMSPSDKVDVIIRCVDPLDPGSVSTDELLPALKNKANACRNSLDKELKKSELEPSETLWIINGIAATVPVASLNGLVHRAGVDIIYLNETVELPPAPVLTGAPGNPPMTYWNISEIRATDLWEFGYYGTGVVVATMDTGVDANHADIAPKWRGGSNSWFDPNGQHATPFDASGHGTGVMGLLVGGNAGGFDMGVAPDAQWISVKIFNDQNQSDLARIHQGFQWLLDPDGDLSPADAPDIVNSSWVLQGTEGECLGEFASDIAALKTAGIAVVFSAGNSGHKSNTSMEPANDPASLSVGATDSSRRVLRSSSRGPSACDGGVYPKLVAPGKDVLTAGLTSNGANPTSYAFSTGTSFAAPHVAGAMAVLKSAFPGASMAEIESALGDGALDLGT